MTKLFVAERHPANAEPDPRSEPAQQHADLREHIELWLEMWPEGSISNGTRARGLEDMLRDCLAALAAPPAPAVDVEALVAKVRSVLEGMHADVFCRPRALERSERAIRAYFARHPAPEEKA